MLARSCQERESLAVDELSMQHLLGVDERSDEKFQNILEAIAIDVDHQHGRLLDRQSALEKTDHPRAAERSTDARIRPRSA